MAINKETKSLRMPWEKEYGYSQAVKVGDTIYLSGQVSHDDKGNIVEGACSVCIQFGTACLS
jgi:2-iminobutanoate/2-iminopropanoate deaminase